MEKAVRNSVNGWDGLNRDQLAGLLPLVAQLKYLDADYDNTIVLLAAIRQLIVNNDIIDEAELVSWIGENLWLFNETIEYRPFDYISVNGKRLYLPKENYADTSALELALCNLYYTRYATASDVSEQDNLYRLIATICRPLAKGDKTAVTRGALDMDAAEAMVEGIKTLQVGIVLTVLAYWEWMNKQLLEQYEVLFPKGDDGKPALFEAGEGWLVLLEDVAQDGVYGDLDKVNVQNCHNILLYLKHKRQLEEARAKVK